MAVPRVEWTCPKCGRLFAIRADIPTPAACPQCSGGTAAAGNIEPPSGVTAGGKSQEYSLPDEPAASPPHDEISPTATGPRELPPLDRRYRSLRLLSSVFKILAAVGGIVAIVGLVMMTSAAFKISEAEERTAAIALSGSVLASGLLLALLLWTIGELIPLLLDIEANTRRRR